MAHFPSGKKPSVKERKNSRKPAYDTNVWSFSLSAGTEQEVKLQEKQIEVSLEVQDAHKALPQGYRGKEVRVNTMAVPGIFILTRHAGPTILVSGLLLLLW